MGISSLGAGSSILTQDVIDQLRAADESKFVTPLDSKIKAEDKKSDKFDFLNAHMDNLYESLKSLNEYGVFEARSTSVGNDSIVEINAKESSDIQDFSLEVENIATKEIVQSGSFDSKTAKISDGDGSMKLSVGDKDFTIDYNVSTTLEDLKNLINDKADGSVSATIVQVSSGNFKLLLSSDETGTGKDISITDNDDHLSDKLLDDADPDDDVDGMTTVQDGVDAKFKFNGVEITRESNSVDDLLSGVTITLKDVGKTNVNIQQDREHIEERITNFVDKYNSAIYQLGEDTKSSQEVSERGAFSSDSVIKGMKSSLVNIISTVGEGQGKLLDFGIEVGDDGRLSLNSTKLNEKLDEDPANVKSFFTGGTFTKSDGHTVELKGVFDEIETEVAKYSKYGAVLDKFKDSMSIRTKSLTEQKEKAIERLDTTYATMKKRFASYDLMISKFNNASSMFTQMIDAELAAKN